MKRLILLIVILLGSIGYAQTPARRAVPNGLPVVQKFRPLFPTPLGVAGTNQLLRLVAAEMNGGIYKKPAGNNCLGYSCDIVCFPQEGVMFDVLVDSENLGTPAWSGPMAIPDINLCERVSAAPNPIPGPAPDPQPIPPTSGTASTAELQQQQIVLLMQMLSKQEEQNAQLRQAIVDLRAEISKGVKIRW